MDSTSRWQMSSFLSAPGQQQVRVGRLVAAGDLRELNEDELRRFEAMCENQRTFLRVELVRPRAAAFEAGQRSCGSSSAALTSTAASPISTR